MNIILIDHAPKLLQVVEMVVAARFAPPAWSFSDTDFCVCNTAARNALFDEDLVLVRFEVAPHIEN
jgi:hypothetical protein